MVKKINKDANAIQAFLEKGYNQAWIARKLGISKQKVNYWSKTAIKTVQNRRSKLSDEYKKKIVELAEDKLTSDMGSRKIANIINDDLKSNNVVDKRGKLIQIEKTTVNRILKKALGKPRKIRKVFFLTNEQKKKRLKFCKSIIAKNIKNDQIFFSDETKIDLSPFLNDSIRLSKENQDKLKKGDEAAHELINRPKKKFEKSISIGGAICYYGLSNLLLLEGTENEFSYAQALYYYKEDIEEICKKNKCSLLFEQDGAKAHTSKSNINLLNKLFTSNGWLQNPPNSPDIAYPIETLWATLKKRVKKRDPKTIEDLKTITLQEWNRISPKLVRRFCLNFVKRIKKIIEINGSRLEPFHLNQIKKEINDEIGEEKEEDEDENDFEGKNKEKNELKKDLKLKPIYNNEELLKMKKKEILELKKQTKKTLADYNEKIKKAKPIKKRDLKNLSYGRALSLLKDSKGELKKEKKDNIDEIKRKIDEIGKMNMIEYLKYLNEKRREKESNQNEIIDDMESDLNSEESTIEDLIAKILKIKEISEDKNNDISYKLNFDLKI